MPATSSAIKIAIIGGGLAGVSIANALLRYAHLDVHVYESAPEFSERGAAVGLAGDSQRAMKQVVGESKAVAMLDNAGAVLQASSRLCIVRLRACFGFMTKSSWILTSNSLGLRHARGSDLSGSCQ